MANAGKSVSILRCTRPVPSDADLNQQVALQDYLGRISTSALIMNYDSDVELANRVNNILSHQTARFYARVSSVSESTLEADLGVWPSIDVRERVETDSKGRTRTRSQYFLSVSNKSATIAKNVAVHLDSVRGVRLAASNEPIDVLGPEAEVRFLMVIAMGSPPAFNCRVTWVDSQGKARENVATLTPI